MNAFKYIRFKMMGCFLLFGIISFSLKAQSAYHGGKGDGYASAEIHNIVLGIDDAGNETPAISVYPNPATQGQSLNLSCSVTGGFHVDIVNLTGQVVATVQYEANSGILQLKNLSPGTYLMRLSGSNWVYHQKLVVL
jgi:hypothetical protein